MQKAKLTNYKKIKILWIKRAIIAIALLLIIAGTALSVYKNNQPNPATPTQEQPAVAVEQTALPVTTEKEEKAENNEEDVAIVPDATSYDDQLTEIDDEIELPPDAQLALDDLLDAVDQALRITNQFSYTIASGDKLVDVLQTSGLDNEAADELIAVDPELQKLKVGQQFYWILDADNNVEFLNWLVSKTEERIYMREEDNKLTLQIIEKESVWKTEVLRGSITGSLYSSLTNIGLDPKQIHQLTNALQWQLSMRSLKKEDKFALLVNREYLDGKLTGQGNVDAIHILAGGKSYYAIQASNGNYYNNKAETVGRGFARYPMQRQAKISSHFNLKRKHPITGKITPHFGTDFPLKSGTPVIAPADGVVQKIAFQGGGAGRYIIIKHGREYQTIYMHLSKPLVKAGQSVKRGDRIALSGNSGRSTGPHLHYEFHINGRPVNPMTVKLPGTNTTMNNKDRNVFLAKVKQIVDQLKI